MIVLAFDTETTGLIESRIKRAQFQPYVIQFCGWLVDLEKNEVRDKLETFIRPPSPEHLDAEGVKKSSKITWDMVKDKSDFAGYACLIREMIESAPAVAAHNLVFDRDMIDLEMKRYGVTVKWPERQICTVEVSNHINGYRMTLTDLHSLLVGSEFTDAHDAVADVAALTRCLVEMEKRDWL
jgi:DNA polymerase III alpha subunit (gram-positive type)